MKKWFTLVCAAGLCACAGVNKNTVSYQMSKYDQHTYYVVAGEGPDKEAAGADALANMQKALLQAVPDAEGFAQINDLVANAKVGKVWRDKSRTDSKNYFALAV